MTLLATERQYTGRIINLDIDTVGFPGGSQGRLEMIRHPGASAVVPIVEAQPARDPSILLIRQFRHAADGFIWEIPAGRLDPGESPESCAGRELEEEAGVRAEHLERLTTVYTTPGFTDERIHLFLARGLRHGTHAREADEFVEVHPTPWSLVREMIREGEIVDGKTIIALLYAAAFAGLATG